MNGRTLITLVMALAAIICPAAVAQQTVYEKKSGPEQNSRVQGGANQTNQVSMKLDRGGKVTLTNRTGAIVITGWDRDTVEAKAIDGTELVPIEVSDQSSRSRIFLSVPYSGFRRSGDVRLDVKLPRYADIESINSQRADIEVTGIDGAVSITSGSGDVRVSSVGSLRINRSQGNLNVNGVKGSFTARTTHGDVLAENVGGFVDLATTHGNVSVREAGGDLRANSTTGDVQVRCAKGRADVTSANGSVMLTGIAGDLDAYTANGNVIFTGPIRADGRYRLKTLSGDIRMTIQPEPPGFIATIESYSGEIETHFPLRLETPLRGGPINRRIVGRYGDGGARITLDSFSGSVRIIKGTAASVDQCK